MSEGLKYQQRSTDNLELQDTCSCSSLQSLLLPQTSSHTLFSHGSSLFISVVNLPTRPALLCNCTLPEASFTCRVYWRFLIGFYSSSLCLLHCWFVQHSVWFWTSYLVSLYPRISRLVKATQSYLFPPRSSACWPSAKIDQQSLLLFSRLFAKISPSQ